MIERESPELPRHCLELLVEAYKRTLEEVPAQHRAKLLAKLEELLRSMAQSGRDRPAEGR